MESIGKKGLANQEESQARRNLRSAWPGKVAQSFHRVLCILHPTYRLTSCCKTLRPPPPIRVKEQCN